MWQIYPPPSNGNFTDSFSDSSYFIPTVRANIWQTRCGRSTPLRTAISQIPTLDSSYFIPTVRAHIVQTRCDRSTPPLEQQFHTFLLWQLIFYSYFENSYLADHVWQIYPPLTHSFTVFCSDSSYFIPTLTTDIGQNKFWQIYSPSNSDYRLLLWELIFGSPSVGISSPHKMAISHIPALTAHISFLLWELILHRPGVADLPLLSNGNFTDSWSDSTYFIPNVKTHIAQTRCGKSTPPIKWQFHRFLLWQLIFHSYCESSYFWRPDQVLLLWQLIYHSPLKCGRSTPHRTAISEIPSFCESSDRSFPYFIPTVRAHIGFDRSDQM